MTNLEKFKEVFGFTIDDQECPFPPEICQELPTLLCKDCPVNEWWTREYIDGFDVHAYSEKRS